MIHFSIIFRLSLLFLKLTNDLPGNI